MKQFLLFLFLFAFTQISGYSKGYDMTVPVAGDTIADDKLQFNVISDLYSKAARKFPACYDFSIEDTQVVKYPYDTRKVNGRYIKGNWDELWTLKACGKKVQIPISYKLTKKDTVFVVNPELFSKQSL